MKVKELTFFYFWTAGLKINSSFFWEFSFQVENGIATSSQLY